MQSTTAVTADVPTSSDLSRIAQDLQIRKSQVEAVVALLDEGNTVPFITRYRKERTGGLNEDYIRRIEDRVAAIRALADRKQTILKSIEAQGKLSEQLRADITAAETPKRLEDLYLPYKPKKRTLASDARDKGLEPAALAVWAGDPAVGSLDQLFADLVSPEKQLNTPDEVRQGVGHILAELVSETANVRGGVRAVLWETGLVRAIKHEALKENQGLEYRDYFNDFKESCRAIPPHRILALNRGERENALRIKLEWDDQRAAHAAEVALPQLEGHPHRDFLRSVVADALTRLLLPSLEREIRRELTEEAQEHAVAIFARNLRSLLLQPPLRGKRVLAIDPGMKTGCKLAILDETGEVLSETVVYPHPPQNRKDEAKAKIEELIRRYKAPVIAIGNGTGCRETEKIISDLIADLEARRSRGEEHLPVPVPPPRPPRHTPQPPPAPATVPAVIDGTPPIADAPVQVPESGLTGVPAPVESPTLPQPPEPLGSTEPPPVIDATPPGDQGPGSDIGAPVEAPVQAAPEPPPAAPEPPPPAVPAEPLDPAPAELAYVIVNEAGASVYSASPIGREEFPNFDATTRGTISIGRRLQDPLAELVKIEPQHIGVGLYQHDLRSRNLKDSLDAVVESCVNHVGVDVNTASVPLLRHVSGLNQLAAQEIVAFRQANGPFHKREQLQNVPQLGPKRYEQAAGFLKIAGEEPLDQTWIHPESYPAARQLLADLGSEPAALLDKEQTAALREKFNGLSLEETAGRLGVGEPTLRDILDALARPGRDPREDLPPPIFKKGILKLEDLTAGMELKGTVLNVVDFGAFVDIGLKDSGLVHISQMANRYIKSPYDVVAVGDVVTVWVLGVDPDRRRVSLSMIPPGTERRQERQQRPARQEGGERPPQGDRPPQGERRDAGPRHQGGPRPQGGQGGGRGPGPQGGGGGRFSGPPRQGGPGGGRFSGPRRDDRSQQPTDADAPPPRQLPPRVPPKPKPLPTLTQAAREGKAALRTFGELAAFFKPTDAEKPPEPPATPAPEQQAPAETPPPPPPAPEGGQS